MFFVTVDTFTVVGDIMQSGASDQGTPSQQQGLTRLHRRLQRLQDERIHLEGVLAHERSLLAQQRSDNAQLRSQLAAHSSQQADNAAMPGLQVGDASLHMEVLSHDQGDGVHAPEKQQRSSAATDRVPTGLHDDNCQHDADSNGVTDGGRQLANQVLQLQAELALIGSENTALNMELAAQQAQHDSERADLHAAISAEHEDSLHVRQQLEMLSHARLNDSSWHARAVQLQAQHADVVSELHAAQEQCKTSYKQVQVHESIVTLAVTVL